MTPIKYLLKTFKESIKGIKQILKTPKLLLPGLIVSIIWFVLSLLVAKGNKSDIVYIASIITFAQGGMYGGLIGATGGIIGKGILACLVTKLFNKRQKHVYIKIKMVDKLFILLGLGLGLIAYNFLSSNASLTNAVIGVTLSISIVKKMRDPNDFWYGFLPTFSKKINRGMVKSMLVGLCLGFVSGVGISIIKVNGNSIPYIVGVCIIILFILFKVIKNKKVVNAIMTFIAIVVPITIVYAFNYDLIYKGLKVDYKISGVKITKTTTESFKRFSSDPSVITYRETVYGTCRNETVSVNVSMSNVVEVPEDWDDYISHDINIRLNTRETMINPNGIFWLPGTTGISDSSDIMPFQINDLNSSIKATSNDKSISVMIVVFAKNKNGNLFEKQILGVFENLDYVGEDDSKLVIPDGSDFTFDGDGIMIDRNGDIHLSEEDAIVVSVLSILASLLGASFSIGLNVEGFSNSIPDDEYREITDPASGAVTGYKLNKKTNEWVSIDGLSILDPDKLDEWYKNRESDKIWMDEQRDKETSVHKDIVEATKNDKKELEELEKEGARKERERWNFRYECARSRRDYYLRTGEAYSKLGDAFKAAEVTAVITSAVCDAAIDVYGATNPLFAKKYKLLKGIASGTAENGWNGVVSGTINGGADALLVGEKGLAKKAIIRFSSRMVTGTANAAIKGESVGDSLKNGLADGILHAGVGAIMDKTTGKLPKLDKNVWTSDTILTKESAKLFGKELLGKSHGGLQRTIVRGTNSLIIKPFVKGK